MPYKELVLNKKVLILFSTMDRMNKISTFIPHISVSLHLFPRTSRENDKGLYTSTKGCIDPLSQYTPLGG